MEDKLRHVYIVHTLYIFLKKKMISLNIEHLALKNVYVFLKRGSLARIYHTLAKTLVVFRVYHEYYSC